MLSISYIWTSLTTEIKAHVIHHTDGKYSIHQSFVSLFVSVFIIQSMMKGNFFIKFDETKEARLGVLPRYATNESQLRWFTIPVCFIFHNGSHLWSSKLSLLIRIEPLLGISLKLSIVRKFPFHMIHNLYKPGHHTITSDCFMIQRWLHCFTLFLYWFIDNLGFFSPPANAWEEGDEIVLHSCRMEEINLTTAADGFKENERISQPKLWAPLLSSILSLSRSLSLVLSSLLSSFIFFVLSRIYGYCFTWFCVWSCNWYLCNFFKVLLGSPHVLSHSLFSVVGLSLGSTLRLVRWDRNSSQFWWWIFQGSTRSIWEGTWFKPRLLRLANAGVCSQYVYIKFYVAIAFNLMIYIACIL